MRNIKDIICAKTNFDEMYDENNSCIGSIIEENGLFVGILFKTATKDETFVFGTIEEDFMELIETNQPDDELPKSYKCSFSDGKYRGEYLAKSAYYEYPVGECHVSVVDPFYYRETTYGEEINLMIHINHHIQNMDEESKELYRTMILKPVEKEKKKKMKKKTKTAQQ